MDVFLGLGLIILLGSSLRRLFPELDVDQLRTSINTLVLYILLPALIFESFHDAPLNLELLKVPVVMLVGIFGCLGLAWLVYGRLPLSQETRGSLILAASFGNVTYLGLPVLQGLFPTALAEVSEVAILCEITKSPVNLCIGSAIALYYGGGGKTDWTRVWRQIVSLPPLWAAGLALAVNLAGMRVPGFVDEVSQVLGQTVSGLMILSLGMALKPVKLRSFVSVVPALVLKLLVFPALVFLFVRHWTVAEPYGSALIVEGAMPPQLLTFVIADRFGLDVRTLALAVTLGTVVSFLTIPVLATQLPP